MTSSGATPGDGTTVRGWDASKSEEAGTSTEGRSTPSPSGPTGVKTVDTLGGGAIARVTEAVATFLKTGTPGPVTTSTSGDDGSMASSEATSVGRTT